MNRPSLVLVGAGGHAKACIDVIENDGRYQIAGLVGVPDEVGTHVLGYPVIGTDDNLDELSKKFTYALIALGHITSSVRRAETFAKLLQLGFQLPCICAKTAYVSEHAKVGMGTIVMHRAVINANANIGENCIINSAAVIEHDVYIGDHVHISTGAMINGEVQIQAGTFVGSNATVKNNINIGLDCVVGMGISIKQHIPDRSVLRGL